MNGHETISSLNKTTQSIELDNDDTDTVIRNAIIWFEHEMKNPDGFWHKYGFLKYRCSSR